MTTKFILVETDSVLSMFVTISHGGLTSNGRFPLAFKRSTVSDRAFFPPLVSVYLCVRQGMFRRNAQKSNY